MQETKTNEFNKIFDTSRKNLLDMGLRNNLLNFKEVKRTIPIIDEDIGELYNILIVDENSMEFLPKPKKDTNRNTYTLEDKSNRFIGSPIRYVTYNNRNCYKTGISGNCNR